MKKIFLHITFFLLFFTYSLFAGNDKTTIGAQAAAMGGACITQSDVNSVFNNQAGLATLKELSVSLYAENRFLLQPLKYGGLAFALPTRSGTFGAGVTYFGNEQYNEKRITLAYGRNIFEKLQIGIELNAMSVVIPEYNSSNNITFGVGIQYVINSQLKAGGHIFNPMRIQLTDQAIDKIPTIARFGVAFTPSPAVTFIAEAEKNMNAKSMVKVGFEYKIFDKMFIRGGFSSNPSQANLGVGVWVKSFKIDIASGFHTVLGATPQISLTFQKPPKKDNSPAADPAPHK